MSLELVLRDRTRTHGTHNRLFEIDLVVRGSIRGSVELDFHLRKIFLEIHVGSGLTPFEDSVFLNEFVWVWILPLFNFDFDFAGVWILPHFNFDRSLAGLDLTLFLRPPWIQNSDPLSLFEKSLSSLRATTAS